MIVLIIVAAPLLGADDFPGLIVPVLLRIEHAPAMVERPRDLGAQKAVHARIAIGDMDAGDFVVTLVLETRATAQTGIDGSRRVATKREDADRLVSRIGVIHAGVEQERGVECVVVFVQAITAILHKHDFVVGPEGTVVQSGVLEVAFKEEDELAMIACGAVLDYLEDRTKTTETSRLRCRTGVAGRVEEELPEAAARAKLTVLRPFERCCT